MTASTPTAPLRIALTALLALLAASCSDRPSEAYLQRLRNSIPPEFDHADLNPTLLSARVLTNHDVLGIPRNILVVDDYVIVGDQAGEQLLHVFDRGDGSHVRSLGRQGGGPGEFAGPPTLLAAPYEQGRFYAYDITQGRLMRFTLPSGTLEPFGERSYLRLPATHLVYRLEMVGPQRFAGTGFFEHGRLALMDLDRDVVEFHGPVPEDKGGWAIVQHAYKSVLAAHPAGERFALLTRRGSRIELYGEDGGLLRVREGPFPFPVDYTVEGRGTRFAAGPHNRFGYRDAIGTENGILALFSGRAEAHFRPIPGGHGEFIHVFDWEGELNRVFQLDPPVTAIALDEEETAIYAVVEDPAPQILVFPLPDVRTASHD